jgi:hypothetical protein
MIRLRPLTEAECYARCYGTSDGTVRVIRVEPRPTRNLPALSGEALRRRFELLLESRDPDEAAEAA